jgi:hypothetical protein
MRQIGKIIGQTTYWAAFRSSLTSTIPGSASQKKKSILTEVINERAAAPG